MSDLPNIVNVIAPQGKIEVIDNSKLSTQVFIVELPENVLNINTDSSTIVTPITETSTNITPEKVVTNIVQVVDQGPQGAKGDQGTQGIRGLLGPRGPQGTGINVLGVTSSLHIYNETVNDINALATGSWYILDDTADRGNGISGSIGEGLIYFGLPWRNTGRIQGDQGPEGIPGPSINTADYNSANGLLTFGLNDGSSLTPIGPINGTDGDNGATGPAGVGIDTIEVDGTQLKVKLTTDAEAVALGNVQGPQGPQGPQGEPGTGGSGGSVDAALTSAVTVQTTVGNATAGFIFNAGTTLQQIVEKIFVKPFVAAVGTISSITVKNGGSTISSKTINYGTGITFNSIQWSPSTGQGGTLPTVVQVYANNETPGFSITGISDNASPYSFSSVTLYKDASTLSSGATFDVKAKIQKTDGTFAYPLGCRITVRTPRYFGATTTNASAGSNSSTINTILGSIKGQQTKNQTSKSTTFTGNSNTTNASKYVYFAIPAHHGNITSVYFSSNPSTNQANAMSQIKSDYNYTVGSQTLAFDIYKFNNPGAIPNGEGVTVS